MDSNRKLLKIAGILYGITGVLLLEAPFYGIFLIIAGIYIFSQSNESAENLYKNRALYYVISVIGLANVISSVLVMIAQDDIAKIHRQSNGINAPPKVIYTVDEESKKIDILLKLGVVMIFISGLLFATTSWDFINDYVKALALIAFGSIFLFLSLFTERKLKLYRSSYMYWLLSMSLFLLTIVGILYFGIFGNYLTFGGGGSSLAYAITFLTGAGFAATTYYKFPKKYLLFTCYACIVAALAFILDSLHLSQMMNVGIISLMVMITNIVHRTKGTVYTFSKILSYMLFGFIITASFNSDIEILLACLINIVNLNYLTFLDVKEEESLVNILLTYVLIFYGLYSFAPLGDCTYIMIALTTSIYTILVNGNVIPTKSFTTKLNYLAYSISMVILFLITINLTKFYVPSTFVFVPMIHLAINFMIKKGWFKIEPWRVANFIEPVILFALIDAVVTYFHDPIALPMQMAITSLVYGVIHYISKDSFDKKIYYWFLMGANILAVLSQNDPTAIYSSLIVIAVCLYQFVSTYMEEDENKNQGRLCVTYTTLLSSLYIPFISYNILEINAVAPSLIFIVLIYIIAPLLKNDWIKKISYLYVVLPLTSLIHAFDIDYVIQDILESVTGLYIIFLINKFFVKNKTAINIISIFGLFFFLIGVFFQYDILAGVYVGIIGIATILIGYRKDSLYPVFVTGIVITVLNILYRLKDVWLMIPFWLYLLVGGLTIIGFVTNRELKKQNQKNANETKSKE